MKSPNGVGRRLGRNRGQDGWVERVGKKTKKWRGNWTSYSVTGEGLECRHHHTRTLGLCAEISKTDAKNKLREIINRETHNVVSPDPDVTFLWFWTNRYLPLMERGWSEATRSTVTSVISTHFLSTFGERRLGSLDKVELQNHLYGLAAKESRSVAKKIRVYVYAALEEAVDQDYLRKNPARKWKTGPTRETNKRNLNPKELCVLLYHLTGEDHLIIQLFLLTALRPGEMFALRWSAIDGDQLFIHQAVRRVKKGQDKIGPPKTKGSRGFVYLTRSLQTELEHWKQLVQPSTDEDYIFSSRNGTPKDAHNYLQRHLKPLSERLGVEGVTFQALRRTFATLMAGKGPKNAQTQLRHSDIAMTLGTYVQPVPEEVKAAVESLDTELQSVLHDFSRDSEGVVQ
jgi:integrase